MSYGSIAIAGIGALMNMSTANKNRNLARTQYEDAKELRKEQQKLLDKQKAEYKAQTFVNPYKDMENTYEDLTVNTQQAEFMAKQGSQQRANIMQGFREAAGASGIAGLAQAMANQGALQTAQISANIGKQESANRLAAAKGAAATQLAERQGEQVLQQMEADRQATLLGMQMGEATGANQAVMQAQANQMNAQIATQQATMNFMGTLAKSGIGKQIGEGVQKEFFSGDGKE
tara:strand:- start:706 stop:1401 length:696 start_codon:yes stop_codon:yes gene_type:complete